MQVVVKKTMTGISEDIKQKSQFFLNSLPQIVDRELSIAVEEAKNNHRFINRSGTLESSIMHEVKVTNGSIDGSLFIHDRANYGVYIHEGFKSWEPDRFLEQPFNTFVEKIEQQLNNNFIKSR